MASIVGAGGGKSRSQSGFAGNVLNSVDNRLASTSGLQGLNNELLSQITEALRTGGVGAQLPIIQQSLSQTNQATSDAMRGTESSLASSGLTRTPYGQSILAGQRMSGAQTAARVPTDIAQAFIAQGPSFAQSLMGQILGAAQKSTSRSGSYAT